MKQLLSSPLCRALLLRSIVAAWAQLLGAAGPGHGASWHLLLHYEVPGPPPATQRLTVAQ